MVTKSRKGNTSKSRQKGKTGGVKLNKETVKDLSHGELEKVQGGRFPATVILCISKGCPPPPLK